jgi:uncharacterized metal-binding protein
MANALAVRADRAALAEMSCIAGVGGDVVALVKTAKSGRDIVVLDGCSLECAKNCLARHNVTPTVHMKLSDFQVKKVQHGDYDPAQAEALYTQLKHVLDR